MTFATPTPMSTAVRRAIPGVASGRIDASGWRGARGIDRLRAPGHPPRPLDRADDGSVTHERGDGSDLGGKVTIRARAGHGLTQQRHDRARPARRVATA